MASDAGGGLGLRRCTAVASTSVDPVRLPGGVDGARDVGRFLVPQVGLDRELLHHRRVDAADRDRGDAEQGQRRAGPDQVAHARVGEDQDRDGDHDRDVGQDLLGRQHRVDVGVAGAPQVRAGVEVEQQRRAGPGSTPPP